MTLVELRGVRKTFAGANGATVRAVDDLHLAVGERERVTVVGPSGCGKTTLLRLIAGLETPEAGEIHIAGRLVNRVPPRERDVAMVFQSHALYPHLTAAENLGFGLKLRGVASAEIRQRVQKIAEWLGLTACLARRPGELSGGERQRVAVGRALIRRPRLLLLDEPFANLDAPLRRELRRELLKLHSEFALTVLLVTHDQAEALALGERVAVMRAGRVEQIGSPMEIREKPATPFVAGFFDTDPI